MTSSDTSNPIERHLVQFRIQRGAAVLGTDGTLGTVEQIVVDNETGQLRALVVQGNERAGMFELAASHVRRALENQVEVDIGRADLVLRPHLVQPYDATRYGPHTGGQSLAPSAAGEAAQASEQPIVTGVEANAAELVTLDPDLAPTGEEDTIILNQRGGQSLPLARNPDTEQQAARTAAALPPDASKPRGAANPAPGFETEETLELPRSAPVLEPQLEPPATAGTDAVAAPVPEPLVAEAPPAPVERHLPPADGAHPAIRAARSPRVASPTPTQVPWGVVLPAAGALAVGMVLFIVRRVRKRAAAKLQRGAREAQRNVSRNAAHAQQRIGALATTLTDARNQAWLRDQAAERTAAARTSVAVGWWRLRAGASQLPERLRWLRRGARTGSRVAAPWARRRVRGTGPRRMPPAGVVPMRRIRVLGMPPSRWRDIPPARRVDDARRD